MSQLFINVTYAENDKITQALFECLAFSGSKPRYVRVTLLGIDLILATLVISGSWDELTHFKNRFSILKEQYHLSFSFETTLNIVQYPTNTVPYIASITTPWDASHIYHTTQFFLNLPIKFCELSSMLYKTPMTETDMMEIQLTFITLPDKGIHGYRDRIFQFCDENNFEIILESKKY